MYRLSVLNRTHSNILLYDKKKKRGILEFFEPNDKADAQRYINEQLNQGLEPVCSNDLLVGMVKSEEFTEKAEVYNSKKQLVYLTQAVINHPDIPIAWFQKNWNNIKVPSQSHPNHLYYTTMSQFPSYSKHV